MRPRLQDISNWVVPYVTDKWEKIFVQLLGDEHRHVMATLRRDYQGNSEDGCHAMFEQWLQLCPNPTWDDLITALRATSVRKIALAEELLQRVGMYVCVLTIYPYKRRAHINAWDQVNAGVQHSKVNKHPCKV